MRISIALVVLCLSAPALAQQPDGDAIERAKKHFEVAELHFKEGEYAQAIEQYRKAHALSQEPVLLFNVGLCLEKQGKAAEAIAGYRAYLEADPEGQKAAEARYRLEALEKAAATDPVKEPEGRPVAAPPTLTLRLARDIGTVRLSLIAAGGKELDCPPTSFVAPCVLTDVPPGPAKLTLRKGGDRATATFETPRGDAVRRIAYKPVERGYKNVLLYGGVGALALSAASFVGAGVVGTDAGAFPVFMVSGAFTLAAGFVGTTLGLVGVGGETAPASISVR